MSRERPDEIGGSTTRFKHKLGQGRRCDGRKCFKEECVLGEVDVPTERDAKGQPAKDIEPCQSETLQVIAFYRRKS